MANIINKQLTPIFPSALFRAHVEDMSLVDDLKTELVKLKEQNTGFSEANNFVSQDDLQNLPQFKALVDIVMSEGEQLLDFFGVVRDSHYISNMWGNITDPNHRHPVHIHPNSYLSGIIYLNAPDKCGYTAFTDPRPGARVFEPSYTQMNEWNGGVFMNVPEKGQLLFWNSWLPHGVERGFHNGEEDRIVIAFNIMIKGKISTKTANLVL